MSVSSGLTSPAVPIHSSNTAWAAVKTHQIPARKNNCGFGIQKFGVSTTSNRIGSVATSGTRRDPALLIAEQKGFGVSTTRTASQKGFLPEVDVLIVGGGVTGSALLYELAEFTDIGRVMLLERRDEFARVSSGPNNNSQTIHCGDIETNYTVEKAATVKQVADMLKNFSSKLPDGTRENTTQKMQKMALGVGSKEVDFITQRHETFGKLFPKMRLLNKTEIARVEPWVGYSSVVGQKLRQEPLVASYIEDDLSAVDYYNLTKAFIQSAHKHNRQSNRDIRALTGVEMLHISKADNGKWKVHTSAGTVTAKYVAVCACGHSLLVAHRLGFAKHFSCLPVAGSFYFAPKILSGKVYTVQNPLLPFAAVHGDPDLVANGNTRFGPTALPLPMLERYNMSTVKDFLEVLKPSPALLKVYWDLFSSTTIRNYMIKNVLFEVPMLNRRLFLRDVRKICPGLNLEDLQYAKGFGGIRPQIIDKKQSKLILGEGKIVPDGENITFNVTPSPGGTTCIGNAEKDMRTIVKAIGGSINEKHFKATLLEGAYPVDPQLRDTSS